MMMRSMHCVSIEVMNLPTYDGLIEVDDFLNKFEREVLEQQHFESLKWVLRTMPTRWWGIYEISFEDWCEWRRKIHMRFGKPQMWLTNKIARWNVLCTHRSIWIHAYGMKPAQMSLRVGRHGQYAGVGKAMAWTTPPVWTMEYGKIKCVEGYPCRSL